MKTRTLLSTAVMAVLSFHAITAFAWGNQGHQTVGAMADRLLAGTHAEAQIKAILNPGETLEKVSIWADCAKGYCGPLTPEMKVFVGANPAHHDYHYTDVPFQKNDYAVGDVGTKDHDVVQTLKQAIAVLQGNDTPATNPHHFDQRQALLLIDHMVGDVHQPLHVGTAYMDAQDEYVVPPTQASIDNVSIFETQGDNFLKVGSRALHAYWDTQAVQYAMRRIGATTPGDFADKLIAQHGAVPKNSGKPTDWPEQWAKETLQVSHIAHRGVEPGEREEVQDRNGGAHYAWQVTTPSNYARTVSTAANDQLGRAGYRLAELLKTIWP